MAIVTSKATKKPMRLTTPIGNQKVFLLKCWQCGKMNDANDVKQCGLCKAKIDPKKKFKFIFDLPKGYTLFGLHVCGRVVSYRHCILNNSITVINRLSRKYQVNLSNCEIILQPERSWDND